MIILFNLIDLISKKPVDDMSCQDLYKSKQVIDSEIAKRKALKTKQIDQEYKDIKTMITNKYNKFASELNTTIPRNEEDILCNLVCVSPIDIPAYFGDGYRISGSYEYAQRRTIIDIIRMLTRNNIPVGTFLYFMRENELNKVEMNRIEKISKL